MNNLNQYILEKLKVNSNSKINDINIEDLVKDITDFLYYKMSVNKTVENIIKKWIKDNKIKYVSIVVTQDILDRILSDFDTSINELKEKYNENHINTQIVVIGKEFHKKFDKDLGELKYNKTYSKVYVNDDKVSICSSLIGNIYILNNK